MKIIIVLLLFTGSVLAQDKASLLAAAGCGPSQIQFDAMNDKHQHPIANPEQGKAIVYVITGKWNALCIGPCATYRVGLDGAWVGASRRNSYFFFSVEPGDHNMCMDMQTGKPRPELASAASFTAEPAKVYYFRARMREGGIPCLEQVDNAEAQLLVANSAFSSFRPRK